MTMNGSVVVAILPSAIVGTILGNDRPLVVVVVVVVLGLILHGFTAKKKVFEQL